MTEHVKYPFQGDDGRWAVRYHIPYSVRHEGQDYGVLASIYAEPRVHGTILVSSGGRSVVQYTDLTPGDVVDITGDAWRVAGIEYRSHITLEPAGGADPAGGAAGAAAGADPSAGAETS